MHYINRFLTSMYLLAALPLYSQTNHTKRVISGLVTSYEEAMPVEGVQVYIKGTTKSSGTQSDGIYYITITEKDSILVFSTDHFKTEEVRISAANEYNVVLKKASASPSSTVEPFTVIGNWRGLFELKPGLEIPFNFKIIEIADQHYKAYFLNAEEKFEAGMVQQRADSLFIAIDQFDNELAFKITGQKLSGVLRRQDKTGSPIQLIAEKGKDFRFSSSGTRPSGDISGLYDIVFTPGNGNPEQAVGLFKQEGNKLSATFLRITGDSRYLEGTVEGNSFYLSSFIGSSPAYYKGSFTPNGQISGEILGARGSTHFTGTANDNAALPDPYKLTLLKEGYKSLDFSFPDVNGKKISLKDEKFRNKVVVITITGTWCPNCVDEASFLAPWYKLNRSRGVEAVAIHYERQTDTAFVRKVLTRFRNKFDIQYEQVIAGPADKQFVASSLPALNTFLSFPTTIIVDKKGNVARIHTGYCGPATGRYYEEFVKEFNREIDSLLKN